MDHTSYENKLKDGRNKKVRFSRPTTTKMMTKMTMMTTMTKMIMITF